MNERERYWKQVAAIEANQPLERENRGLCWCMREVSERMPPFDGQHELEERRLRQYLFYYFSRCGGYIWPFTAAGRDARQAACKELGTTRELRADWERP